MRQRIRPSVLVLAFHAAIFAALAWWSWRTWPDPLIDFGRELYVPWQLTRGAVLYRDIASLFGPLSPHVNALWMRLFGVSLMTLAWCNMAIFAATTAGIYSLIRQATDRATASAATLATLALFGFSQYVPVGNYNFVTPYAHEATHGLALSVAMFVCLQRGLTSGRARWFAAAGVAFGLVNLTKPEIAVAAAAALAVTIAAVVVIEQRDGRWLGPRLAIFVAAAVLPPLAFFVHFLRYMPPMDAARAVAGAWTSVSGTIAASPFYRAGSGLDAPLANLGRMLATYAASLLFAIAAAWAAPSKQRRLVVLAVAVLLLSRGAFPRALPLMALTSLVFALAQRRLPLVMWSAFATVLLAKIALNARIVHYGFYLALPATTASIVLLCRLIPDWLETRGFGARSAGFRQIAFWTIAAAAAPYVGLSQGWFAMKTVPVASGGDRFYAADGPERWQGRALNDALEILSREARPDATIAVLPEGIMLNYLLRRSSPLPAVSAMPPELAAFGEDRFVAALSSSPPDFVVVIRRDMTEYGVPPFGTDSRSGAAIMSFVQARYRPWRSIEDGAVGIFERR